MVHVEVADDPAASCAAGAALEEALRLRLPGVRVEREGATQPGDLRARLDSAGARGRSGAAARTPPERHRLLLALGPAAWLGGSSDLRAAALLTASLRAGENLQGGLLVLGGAASSQPVLVESAARGQTRVQQLLLAAEVAACAEVLALRLCGGPLAGARGSLGSSSGALLFQEASALIVQPQAGLHASMALRLSGRFTLRLDLISAAAPGSGSVRGAGRPPPPPPA